MRRLVLICGILLTTLSTLEVVARVVGRLTYQDPFAPYQAIMPGEPSSALERYSCKPWADETTSTRPVFCQIIPNAGPFDVVFIDYEYNGVIRQIGFSVQRNRLNLGDLLACWGKPTSFEPEDSDFEMGNIDMHWGKRVYAVFDGIRYGARLNYFVPIEYVSIEGAGVTCSSS
jgi:hypothetical protein